MTEVSFLGAALAARGAIIVESHTAKHGSNDGLNSQTNRCQMKRLFILLLPMTAFAQQDFPRGVTVCWDNADSYVDGTLIEAGDLENVRIEIYRHNDTIPAFTATIPASGEGLNQCELFASAIPQPGTYRVEGYSIVIGGIESDPSEALFKKYVGKPRSITLISVE